MHSQVKRLTKHAQRTRRNGIKTSISGKKKKKKSSCSESSVSLYKTIFFFLLSFDAVLGSRMSTVLRTAKTFCSKDRAPRCSVSRGECDHDLSFFLPVCPLSLFRSLSLSFFLSVFSAAFELRPLGVWGDSKKRHTREHVPKRLFLVSAHPKTTFLSFTLLYFFQGWLWEITTCASAWRSF